MGLSQLTSQKVFLDSAPLIYFIEGNSPYQANLSKLFIAFDSGRLSLVTSTITLLEVLVQPMKFNRKDLVEQYSQLLSEVSGIEVVALNAPIAVKAAELRAKYLLRTPDSIQVATAITSGANFFLTNDFRLKKVGEITIVTPNELV